MNGSEKVRGVWNRLVVGAEWPARRIFGEIVLALVLGLFAAALEALEGGGPLQLTATALTVSLLSPLRRILPASVLVLTGAASGLLSGFMPLLIASGWSAGRGIAARGRAIGAFSAALVLHVAISVYSESDYLPPVATAIFSTVIFLATTIVPGLASRYWRQRRRLLHTLQQHNAQLLRERAMIAGQARMRERQRIAQDMHDSLGHQLALIAVHTGALEVDPELTDRQREAVGVLRGASVAAMHELREVVGILRDGTEAPPPVEGAQPASRAASGIEGLVESSRAAGAEVGLQVSGEPRALAPAADHAAYRIAQEGLTNAHKYASGSRITVALRYEPDSLVVEVANGAVPVPVAGAGGLRNGVPVGGGQGLVGLSERARLIGGMVHAGPTPDGGFRVAGVLPYGPDGGGGRGRGGASGAVLPDAASQGGGGAAGAADRGTGPSDVTRHGDGDVDFWPEGGSIQSGGDPYPVGTFLDGTAGMPVHRSYRAVALGCGILAFIAVALGALAVWGTVAVMEEAGNGMIEPELYRSIKAGEPEAEVRDKLPEGSALLTGGLGNQGPARPKGATCLTMMSTEVSDDPNTEPVFRFCFRDGKLIQKRSYVAKI
ncbi:sensor histidine kinase [Streptomyces sp. NPDC048639]|uniref:sensor histidine kinase n=1 Tax=Streptomyces sp. NPDC048639 TaxID=3365581 RepID=UPI003720A969